jgi:hypothetical protein
MLDYDLHSSIIEAIPLQQPVLADRPQLSSSSHTPGSTYRQHNARLRLRGYEQTGAIPKASTYV